MQVIRKVRRALDARKDRKVAQQTIVADAADLEQPLHGVPPDWGTINDDGYIQEHPVPPEQRRNQ